MKALVILLLLLPSVFLTEARTKVHIVYLGEKTHNDPQAVVDSHHDMLASVVGSKELVSELMVYNYKHGFSGFAAKLTESQARRLAEMPGVVRVIPNSIYKLQTTRSWDYLGLSASSSSEPNVLQKSNMGDGVIIGVFDTAHITGPSGTPILADGSPQKLADPFDFGGGIINPNAAANPGLVYDMDTADYIHYLCAMRYSNSAISHLTRQRTTCPSRRPSILDLNLPSITIPHLANTTTLTRTVTNVGSSNSKYRALVEAPAGVRISVKPSIMSFRSSGQRLSFKVTVYPNHRMNTGFLFGSLTWTNVKHSVRIPLAVRTEHLQSFVESPLNDEF